MAEPFKMGVGQIFAKVESTEGTDAVVALGDAFLAQEVSWGTGQEFNEKDSLLEDVSQEAQVPGKRLPTISFKVCAKGSGTAGTAPDWGTLLLGCQMSETVVAVTSVTYNPISDADSSLTIAFYKKKSASVGKKIVITGCRGNASASWANGAIEFIDFTFTGGEYTETDSAPISSVSTDTTTPLTFQNVTFSLDSKSDFKISSFDWDLGNSAVAREDPTKASGHLSAFLVKPKSVGRFDPEEEIVATYDILGKMRSGSEGALSVVSGATAGNIMTITSAKVQYLGVEDADRNGYRIKDANLQFIRNSGNDHFVIALT